MRTDVLRVDPEAPAKDVIARAAAALRAGGLVAFPTETVYGLGANALDAVAVGRIFAAKGRPAANPVIVHVARAEEARALAADWPETAARLAARFWPGPLTLVLPRREIVPDIVTAGGPTVAIRVPAHPVALALLAEAGVPIAAPSANRSTSLSPTRAEHVLRGLDGRIEMILDGGPTAGGLESTVLDVTTAPPQLLRPGLITPAQIEAEIGTVWRSAGEAADGPARSPGLLRRHYAPRTPLECVTEDGDALVEELLRSSERVGWIQFGSQLGLERPGLVVKVLPREPAGYAAGLYAALHALDTMGVDRIVVTLPPLT
ncbi:MAG TPA: L-threonylcarbamoyladenylate synthase, partial [Roseiflexaceae bacterium]|nr:L-threonylcarbamoyladenylate synthase [Gemmataceae bacterium]